MGELAPLSGPDFTQGVSLASLREGQPLLGHAHGEAVILVKDGGECFALSATCSHYSGPLGEGIVAGGSVRCPLHHACFDVRSGRAVSAPALSPIATFEVHVDGDKVRVGDKRPPAPSRVVIVGSGAAGAACAEALREEGYTGPVTLLGGEAPVDRPNLSKDYLAGTAPEEWLPLRPVEFYRAINVELVSGDAVAHIDVAAHEVHAASGKKHGYGALLLATGAEPIVLPIPGANLPHVFVLRSLADSRALVAKLSSAKKAVVIGASFIGLEAAASLRQRGLSVTVVAPENVPLERVLGAKVGQFVRSLHEAQGVQFELGKKPARIEADQVVLDDDRALGADLVVMGVGVRPAIALAEKAGLKIDKGVVVDGAFRTSAADVYAAGDIARFPFGQEQIRIEHWAVAERQGQAAARAMLGRPRVVPDTPFFWSQHYDVTIRYTGHAERFDVADVRGNLDKRDAHIVYRDHGAIRAVATVNRDRLSLEVARAFEVGDTKALAKIVGD